MKSIIYTSILFLMLASTLRAQTSNSFETSFETQAERDSWEEYKLGAVESPFNKWEFESINGHTGSYSVVHYYPVGGTEITDDWIVSSEINFAGGGTIDSLWTYYAGFGMPFGIDTIALYLITGDQDPSLASEQKLLYLFTDSTYQNDNTWRKITDIAVPSTIGNSYLAFRYKTTINWLDIKIDDIGYTVNWAQSVNEIANLEVSVFPNPSNGDFTIKTDSPSSIEIELFDLLGKRIKHRNVLGNASISGLTSGIYYLIINSTEGNTSRKVIVN